MWKDLGISSSTGVIVFVVAYFIIKWAVKNGINQSILGKSMDKKNFNKNNLE